MGYSIITGGSSGLGFEIATLLAKRKVDLILIGRNEDKLQIAQTQLNKIKDSGNNLTYSMDLSDEQQIHSFVGFLKKQKLQVMNLYNVAGS